MAPAATSSSVLESGEELQLSLGSVSTSSTHAFQARRLGLDESYALFSQDSL